MPTMANITVMDADGTTARVFTALTPAGADGTPAVWRYEDATKTPAQRVRFEVSARWNATKSARKVSTFLNAPIIVATPVAGVFNEIGNVQFRDGGAVIPQGATDATVASATAFAVNLQSSVLIKSVFTSGFAPN